MDLMAEINEFLSSPEQVRARQARREARAAMLYSQVGLAAGRPSAVMEVRASGWNIPLDEQETVDGSVIGAQHPGTAALLVVRRAFGEYQLPTKAELRYSGMKRASGHGAFAMDEGLIFVEATLHSMSGPRHTVDVPVIVREGRILAPSILIHNGNPRVLAQSTFDDILGMGEFKADMPDRNTMFSPPPDKGAAPRPKRQVPLLHPGMFSVAPARKLIQGALSGFLAAEDEPRTGARRRPGPPASQETLDALSRARWKLRQVDLASYDDNAMYGMFMEPKGGYRQHEAEAMLQYVLNTIAKAEARPPIVRQTPEEEAAWRDKLFQTVQHGPTTPPPLPATPPARDEEDEPGFSKFERAGFYEPDVVGVVENGSLGRDTAGADNSYLDVAERPMDDMPSPGQEVTLKTKVTVRDRGGVAYEILKGSKGMVVRDVDGANWAFIVSFPDLGFSATVPRNAL